VIFPDNIIPGSNFLTAVTVILRTIKLTPMKKVISVSLIIIIISGLFCGCEKKGNPPTLPPAETMTMDFSDFTAGRKSATAVENINWSLAATIAGVWNTILAVNIAIPVASFHLAANNQPVYLDNKKWEWKYNVDVIGAVYKARLTGQIRSADIKWEMYVAREGVGSFAEFLWFEGTTNLDGKSGQWILNHSQQFQEPMLRIDWALTGSNVGSIKYTYIRDLKDNRTADPFKTSYIDYGLTAGTYNAFYNVSVNLSGTPGDFKIVNIEWSTSLHKGHIKAPYYFGDSIWHCWDSNGNDDPFCN
jgi:predicted small lipoprotein YifL